jgi:hypothetical protein
MSDPRLALKSKAKNISLGQVAGCENRFAHFGMEKSSRISKEFGRPIDHEKEPEAEKNEGFQAKKLFHAGQRVHKILQSRPSWNRFKGKRWIPISGPNIFLVEVQYSSNPGGFPRRAFFLGLLSDPV